MKKILVRFFVFIALVLFSFIIFAHCIDFRKSNSQLTEFFSKNHQPHQIKYYKASNREIRYISTGKENAATILFIHGAPSSSSYYLGYLSDKRLYTQAKLFAVDRPGYGYSGLGDPVYSIEKQAKMIKPILDSLNKIHRPVILVGTSYGTSIACKIVMDNPKLVDGLIVVAPALAPGEEKIYPISYPAQSPFINWIVPAMLKSANAEKLHHKDELTAMLPDWYKIKIPVMYIQGAADELVYPSNANFARKKLINAPFLEINMIKGKGHLISFSEKETIVKSILKMINICDKRLQSGKN